MFISGSMGIAAALSFGAVSYFGGVMGAPATRPTVTIAAGGGGTYTNYALEFVAGAPADSGRVNIVRSSQDTSGVTANPLNFGGDFTIEFWIFAGDENSLGASPTCNTAAGGWTDSNIVLDADFSSGGIDNDYGISIGGGFMQFGAADGTNQFLLCGDISVTDSAWHHVAFTREDGAGSMAIYVDGVRDTFTVAGPTGSVAHPQGTGGNPDDHLITLGQEHHDFVARDFTGRIDELRFSTIERYTGASFTAPVVGFTPDDDTAGLFHFDEGSGAVANNQEGLVFTPADVWTNPNGAILVGDGFGPTYVTSTASTDWRPVVHFSSDWGDATGTALSAVRDDAGGSGGWALAEFDMANPTSDTVAEVRVTATDGRAFPSTNYLRYTAFETGTSDGIGFLVLNGDGAVSGSGTAFANIPSISVGDSIAWRWYARYIYPNAYSALDTDIHGEEWPGQEPSNFRTQYAAADTFNFNANGHLPYTGTTDGAVDSLNGFAINGPADACTPPNCNFPLTKTATYITDHMIVRTTTDSIQVRWRISDENGRLLYTTTDFEPSENATLNDGLELATFDASSPANMFSLQLRRYRIGLNGIAGLTTGNDGLEAINYAAFAICSSWCGVYPIPGATASGYEGSN